MNKIILASHGGLSAGMLDSITMIIGHSENCVCYGLKPGEDNIQLANKIEEDIKNDNADKYVIVCDILGGSVSNAVSRLANNENIFVVNGMNMGLVISLVLSGEDLTQQRIDQLIEESKMGINLVSFQEEVSGEDDII